jgi:hypothetical protein
MSPTALSKWVAYQAAKMLAKILAEFYPDLLSSSLAVILARLSPARHSSDFRSVRWFGRSYTFTPGQAVIVRQLWLAWENGPPVVGKAVLLETADLQGESVKDVFRGGSGKDAWGTLIKFDTSGNYWLAPPDETMPELKVA